MATAIRIGNPASWQSANSALQESHGEIGIVSDQDILAAQSWLKSEIFVEPASAASVAGLFQLGKQARAESYLPSPAMDSKSDTAMTTGDYRPIEAEPDLVSIRHLLENA